MDIFPRKFSGDNQSFKLGHRGSGNRLRKSIERGASKGFSCTIALTTSGTQGEGFIALLNSQVGEVVTVTEDQGGIGPLDFNGSTKVGLCRESELCIK